jgi:hypothetical protein
LVLLPPLMMIIGLLAIVTIILVVFVCRLCGCSHRSCIYSCRYGYQRSTKQRINYARRLAATTQQPPSSALTLSSPNKRRVTPRRIAVIAIGSQGDLTVFLSLARQLSRVTDDHSSAQDHHPQHDDADNDHNDKVNGQDCNGGFDVTFISEASIKASVEAIGGLTFAELKHISVKRNLEKTWTTRFVHAGWPTIVATSFFHVLVCIGK